MCLPLQAIRPLFCTKAFVHSVLHSVVAKRSAFLIGHEDFVPKFWSFTRALSGTNWSQIVKRGRSLSLLAYYPITLVSKRYSVARYRGLVTFMLTHGNLCRGLARLSRVQLMTQTQYIACSIFRERVRVCPVLSGSRHMTSEKGVPYRLPANVNSPRTRSF